jgi:hypothetical protein
METWFRSAQVLHLGASHFWKSLLKSLPPICHLLSWLPGRGDAIVIGEDSILGMGHLSFLSQELLTVPRTHKIYFLYQAKLQSNRGLILDHWKSSDDLGISGPLALEWNKYTRALCGEGIHLCSEEDSLLWMGGDQTSTLTEKNVHSVVANGAWSQQLPS